MKPAKYRGELASLALVLTMLLTAFAVSCQGAGTESPSDGADAAVGDEVLPDRDEVPGTQLQSNTVEVYFPALDRNGLVGEFREIFETATPGDRAKQIISDLISGPSGPRALRAVPRGTRLRQAFVLEDGTAYLDFSADLREGVGGGSMEELLTVYAVIDSVVRNVSEIRRVGILVEGKSIETLNGHLDLSRPLKPDFSLIVKPRVVARSADG